MLDIQKNIEKIVLINIANIYKQFPTMKIRKEKRQQEVLVSKKQHEYRIFCQLS